MKKSLEDLLRDTLREPTPRDPSTRGLDERDLDGRDLDKGDLDKGDLDKHCLDAETVAGWFEDTLPAAARTVAEAHAADCARCQALLAAMARTTPAPPASTWWRSAFRGWAVPLAAASAAGVLLWVSLPQRATEPAVSESAAASQPAQEAPALVTTQSPAIAPEAALPSEAFDQKRAVKVAEGLQALRERSASMKAAELVRERALANAAGGAPPAAAPSPAQAGQAAPLAAAVAPPPQAAEPSPSQPEADARAAAPAVAPEAARRAVPPPTPLPSSLAGAIPVTAPASTLVQTRAAQPYFLSSDSFTRWRLGIRGAVQRSRDGGNVWETLATGVPETLTAGASPSPTVCWVVGPRGIVMRTVDGRSWERLTFPVAVDLVLVRALDEKTATVTTVDGRAFMTTDGGKTWAQP